MDLTQILPQKFAEAFIKSTQPALPPVIFSPQGSSSPRALLEPQVMDWIYQNIRWLEQPPCTLPQRQALLQALQTQEGDALYAAGGNDLYTVFYNIEQESQKHGAGLRLEFIKKLQHSIDTYQEHAPTERCCLVM
jgi:hypothetical protein